MAPSATRKPPVAVVGLGVTVKADAHPDPKFAEKPQVRFIEPDGISLDAHVHFHIRARYFSGDFHNVGNEVASGEERLPAVQYQRDAREPVRPGVLPYPLGRALGNLRGHPPGPTTPGLVGHLIHIAVVAGQVAPAVDLNYEITEGNGPPAAGHESWNIKGERPFKRGLWPHNAIKPHRAS